MWKKLCKVYPLYLITTLYPLLTSDMTEWIVAGNYAALLPELKQLGKNLLFLQSWFTEGYFSFNGPSWFLATMMFLYLFNLPAIWLLNKVGKRRWHIPVLVCAMGGVWAMLIVYCYSTQNWDVAYWHYIFPPARMGEYFVGMIFGYLIRELGPKLRMDGKKWKKLAFTLLEIAVLLYWFRCLSRLGNFWRNHSERWMVPNLLLLGVFTLGGGWISDLFRRRPLVRLGDVAFECFLIHNLFILQYGYRHSVPEDAFAGKAYSFLLCLVLTVGASLLVGGGKPSGGRSKNQK